eukprot:1153471-Pelagomonas_calceolata.AAC.7
MAHIAPCEHMVIRLMCFRLGMCHKFLSGPLTCIGIPSIRLSTFPCSLCVASATCKRLGAPHSKTPRQHRLPNLEDALDLTHLALVCFLRTTPSYDKLSMVSFDTASSWVASWTLFTITMGKERQSRQ